MADYKYPPEGSGGGGGSGTVTSVGLAVPSALLGVSGSPVTTSGTITVTLPTRAANLVFAGPSSGSAAAPTFRSLVALDIPNLPASQITSGTLAVAQGGTNLGSYTAGDVLYATGATTLAKLAIGTAGQVLAVNAGATAPEWVTGGGGGGIGGSVGTVDNGIPRADGTGGATLQGSLASIDDNGWMSIPDTDGTRYRFGSGNTPALIYSSSSLLLQPGSGTTFAVSGSGAYRNGNLYVELASGVTFVLDGGASRSVIIKGANRDGVSAQTQDVLVQAGDQTVNTFTENGADLTLRGGNTNSDNAASNAGNASLLGGISSNASNNNPGGDVTIAPGTCAGSGGNGNLILNNIKTASAASDAMTMTNGPTGTAGNPTRFIRVVVDGSNYIMPLWPG